MSKKVKINQLVGEVRVIVVPVFFEKAPDVREIGNEYRELIEETVRSSLLNALKHLDFDIEPADRL